MYPQEHKIVEYTLTVADLEELTTYGGDEMRSFTDKQIIDLGEAIQEAITDTISNFLNHN